MPRPSERLTIGSIYFIQSKAQRAMKIGFTTRPAARLSDIQKGNPERLKMLGVIRATWEAEETLHAALKPFRIGGEWYPDDGFAQGVFDGLVEYVEAAASDAWDGADLDGLDQTIDGHVLSGADVTAALVDILEEQRAAA